MDILHGTLVLFFGTMWVKDFVLYKDFFSGSLFDVVKLGGNF